MVAGYSVMTSPRPYATSNRRQFRLQSIGHRTARPQSARVLMALVSTRLGATSCAREYELPSVRSARRGDAYVDIDALAGTFDVPGGFGEAWRVVNCIENHDVVFAGNGPRIGALGDPSNHRFWYARSRARVAAGLLLAARGIPMLFVG